MNEVKTLPTPDPIAYDVPHGQVPTYQRGQVESPWAAPQGANPYLAQYGQDVASLLPASMQAQSKQNVLQGQAAAFGGQGSSSGYPAYPNAFGLGDTSGFEQKAQPSYDSQPLNQAPGMGSSMGFNPWSLTGESNSFI